MKLQIRTKDNLVELLKKGISHAWRVNKGRLNSITEVEIYDFSGKAKISGTFDRENSQILENGRVAVAFKDAKIEQADYKWVGQNPIKYQSATNEEVELMDDEVEETNNSVETFQADSFEQFADWINDLDINKVGLSAERYYADICNNISRLYEINQVDGDFLDVYQERLIDAIDIEILRPELDRWRKEQSDETIQDLIDEAEIGDVDFDEEIMQTWKIFLFWGRMWDGRTPYNDEFLSIFNNDEIKKSLTATLYQVVNDLIIECQRNA